MAAIATIGCSTPYQAKGFRGGFEETRLGAHRWLIAVEVNSFTDRSTAVQYTYRRAAELCPQGFDPIDADRASKDVWVSDGAGGIHNMPKSSATLVVECRHAVETWWCTSIGEIGACTREPARCESMRSAATSKLCEGKAPGECVGFGACVEQARVVCSATACFPTPRACLDSELAAGSDGSACKAR